MNKLPDTVEVSLGAGPTITLWRASSRLDAYGASWQTYSEGPRNLARAAMAQFGQNVLVKLSCVDNAMHAPQGSLPLRAFWEVCVRGPLQDGWERVWWHEPDDAQEARDLDTWLARGTAGSLSYPRNFPVAPQLALLSSALACGPQAEVLRWFVPQPDVLESAQVESVHFWPTFPCDTAQHNGGLIDAPAAFGAVIAAQAACAVGSGPPTRLSYRTPLSTAQLGRLLAHNPLAASMPPAVGAWEAVWESVMLSSVASIYGVLLHEALGTVYSSVAVVAGVANAHRVPVLAALPVLWAPTVDPYTGAVGHRLPCAYTHKGLLGSRLPTNRNGNTDHNNWHAAGLRPPAPMGWAPLTSAGLNAGGGMWYGLPSLTTRGDMAASAWEWAQQLVDAARRDPARGVAPHEAVRMWASARPRARLEAAVRAAGG